MLLSSQQQIVSKLEEKIEYKLITTTRKISKKRVKKFTRAEPSWTRIKRKNGCKKLEKKIVNCSKSNPTKRNRKIGTNRLGMGKRRLVNLFYSILILKGIA